MCANKINRPQRGVGKCDHYSAPTELKRVQLKQQQQKQNTLSFDPQKIKPQMKPTNHSNKHLELGLSDHSECPVLKQEHGRSIPASGTRFQCSMLTLEAAVMVQVPGSCHHVADLESDPGFCPVQKLSCHSLVESDSSEGSPGTYTAILSLFPPLNLSV